MKLWIGGEIQDDIAEPFRGARSKVECAINSKIEHREYGIPLSSWDVIAIVRDDNELPERFRYSVKKREMDFRLAVSHELFKAASTIEQEKLVYEMLVRSLHQLKNKWISQDGLDELISDVSFVGANRGWL